MKFHAICLMITVLGGCAQLSGDQWRWLDDPAQQQWVEFGCNGWGREIRFAIPNRLRGSTERVRSNPPIRKGDSLVSMSACSKPTTEHSLLAVFQWDYWWGGFFKESGTDFAMDVSVRYFEGEPGFLDMSPEGWVEWRTVYWKKKHSRVRVGKSDDITEKFFSSYLIEPYRAEAESLTWIREDFPTVNGHILEYHLPISESHVLTFWFRVSGIRGGLEPDLEWTKRRLEMAHKIMASVTISPEPWGAFASGSGI